MREARVYRFNPEMASDSAFMPGALDMLVPGNLGRVLDPRRTPVRVAEVRPDTGFFVLEILDFEDRGARWEIPFESVAGYQFAREARRATGADVAAYAEAIRRLDQPLEIPVNPSRRASTLARLAVLTRDATTWLSAHARFHGLAQVLSAVDVEGPKALREDLERFMDAHQLSDVEAALATQYVRNPHAGEMVKGHRIVLAELGLVSYAGKTVRDPGLFDHGWSRDARAEHIMRRLSFLRALFASEGVGHLVLHRGVSCEGPPHPVRNDTFVSTTFRKDVALAHFMERDRMNTGILIRQIVPVERLFMSYLETGPMNQQYKEAEAVLFVEAGNPLF